MLSRVYDLRKEVELFLEAQGNHNLLHLQTTDRFNCRWRTLVTFSKRLSFSTDIFKAAILAA